MPKLKLWVIVIIALSAAGLFAFYYSHKNTSQPAQLPEAANKTTQVNDAPDSTDSTSPASEAEPSGNDSLGTDQSALEKQLPPTTVPADGEKISSIKEIAGNVLAHITPEHCDNDCNAFKIDLKLYEYCQQSCGISPIRNVSDCSEEKGIQKDYCLKDLAVLKGDFSRCAPISDANIKQACQNRISQDAIENR